MAERTFEPDVPVFLRGGGIAGHTARAVDWSRTPIGPIAGWPQSLRTIVGTLLSSRHPMFLWWGPELIQFYNDGYLPSFGKGKHPAAMGQRGRDCWQEIWPIIWPQIEDVMLRGRPSWNEDQLVPIFRNGRIEEVYWTYGYSPVFDDDGSVGGTLVVCTETTGRVLLDARLRRLRLLAEATADARSASEVLSTALPAFAAPTNDIPFAIAWRADPASGALQRVADFGLLPDGAGSLEAALRERMGGIREARLLELETAGELAVRPWPEPVRQVFVTPVAPDRPGAERAVLAFGLSPRLPFDAAHREHLGQIAEHVSAARARVESFRRMAELESERRNLLLQAPVGTAILTGPDHVFELANPLYCKLVGRSDLLGKAYVEAFPELAGAELPAILDRVYQTGEPFVAHEYPVRLDRTGNGVLEDCTFTFNLEPIRDGTGAVYGMMAVALDITEQVATRRVLEKAHAERERLVADLESASRAKDEFLAILGHELRNPLAPIVTALQLIKLRDGEATREHEVIERQVRHLVRLVDDLLDVSRITRGKVDLRRTPIEIAEPIAKAVEMASIALEERRHELTVEVPAQGLRCDGDPVRLAQVFSNLLTNASRYTGPGGHIRIAASRAGGSIEVSVRDDGIGIPAGLLPRIFDAFVQGQRGADRAQGGLGLGLTVVRNLVELHKGTVTARSAGVGQGTEFVVRLPATDARPAAGVDQRARALQSASGKRVLIVDDNEDAADSLGLLLSSLGNSVVVVHDAAAALQAVGELRPEIAILDIGLPVMDGYELALRLRQDPAMAGCRLVALSGYAQEGDRERSRRVGFVQHLVKPVELDEVLRAIAGDG